MVLLFEPAGDPFALEAVTHSVRTLDDEMVPLAAAALPERLKAKEEAFLTARGALSAAVDEAVATLGRKDEKEIRAAVELLHTRYQELEKVFD